MLRFSHIKVFSCYSLLTLHSPRVTIFQCSKFNPLDRLSRRGDMRDDDSAVSLPVISAGGQREQFRHGHGRPLLDVVHLAFPLPTTAKTICSNILFRLTESVHIAAFPRYTVTAFTHYNLSRYTVTAFSHFLQFHTLRRYNLHTLQFHWDALGFRQPALCGDLKTIVRPPPSRVNKTKHVPAAAGVAH